jgi:two-component sensor histidine kinase
VETMVVATNIVTGLLFATTIVVVIVGARRRTIGGQVAFFLVVAVSFVLFVAVANVLEHAGIENSLDSVEEYFEILVIPFFLLFIYAISSSNELAARKANEKALEVALDERTLLLREIHHRVKNNLQTVAGIVQLQRYRVDDPEVVRQLDATADRIASMGLLHQKLYGSDHYSTIRLDDYLSALIERIRESHEEGTTRVDFDLRIAGVETNVETALPCGLIVNEAVTNSLKHAFAGRDHGRIEVVLDRMDDGPFRLRISDDGPGIPHLTESSRGVGRQLIEGLVQQLDGELTISTEQGTTYVVCFSQVTKEDERWQRY